MLACRWHERSAQAVSERQAILLLDEQQIDLQRACLWVATAQRGIGTLNREAGQLGRKLNASSHTRLAQERNLHLLSLRIGVRDSRLHRRRPHTDS